MEALDPALLETFPNMAMTPAEIAEQEPLRDLGDGQTAFTDAVTQVKAARRPVPEVEHRPAPASTAGPADAGAGRRHPMRSRADPAGLDGAGSGLRVVGRIPPRADRACPGLCFFQRGFYGGSRLRVHARQLLARAVPRCTSRFSGTRSGSLSLTTAICLAIGYPAAYFIATRRSARLRNVLLVLVILPFWTDFLIRTYAWIILLNREGVVNGVLQQSASSTSHWAALQQCCRRDGSGVCVSPADDPAAVCVT